MASNLVLKVSADTKDAAQKLRELGIDVEVVESKTKKATKETTAWDKAMQKATNDNIKNLVNMGAKILTVTTAVTALQKGIKSCFDEALKQDSVAKTRLTEIQSVWSDIKADFGQGLLDSISPALEKLYGWLVAIQKEVARMSGDSGINTGLLSAYSSYKGSNSHYDLSDKSTGALESALEALTNPNNPHGNTAAALWAQRQLQDELDWRKTHFGASYGKFGFDPAIYGSGAIGSGSASASDIKLNWGETPEQAYWRRYGEHIANQGNQIPMAESSSGVRYTPTDRNARYKYEASFLEGQDYAHNKALALIEEEKQKRIDALQETLSEYKSFYDEISGYAVGAFDAMNDCMNTYYNNQIAQIKKSGIAEEDMAEQIDEVKERQFNANKTNSIAQVLIDTASSIMNIWAQHAGNPTMAGILTGLASSTSAMQIAAISGQQYTGLASGGIVSSPTHALIGEGAEKEAVIPLSKLKDFVNPEEGRGAINIVVNVADGSDNSDIAEKVYFAIERAQRTGLLPRWKYA